MIRKILLAIFITGAAAGAWTAQALAAEPIVGTWKRSNGTIIRYAECEGSQYCGTVMSGEFKGKSIGSMTGTGGSYKGTVNKLDEGKTYSGKASVSGNTLSLAGCVAGGLFCKSEKLTRQ